MRRIVELRVGSHLYGTATAGSDIDLKAVVLPSASDILLQRARPTVTAARSRGEREQNQPGDVDHESHSLQRFLELALAGQPLALEMLFAPDGVMTMAPEPLWREVQALAPRLVSRRATMFLRYCRVQAERYGARGERVGIVRQALALLTAAEATHGGAARLQVIETALAELAATTPHADLLDLQVGGGRIMRHLELCGRKAPLHASLRSVREMLARLLAEYGGRARQAEDGQGIDWKALSHAVRVGQEAIELLQTGRLVFPLAGAAHLLDIKLGRLSYGSVAAGVERLLEQVEAAAAASALRDYPDAAAAEALVLRAYRRQVLEQA